MVIETERAVAMRCPACGKLNHQVFSLFEFSGTNTLKLHCSCGFTLLILATRDHRRYSLQTFCVVCESTHVSSLTRHELWSDESTEITCPETYVELATVGTKSTVQDMIRREQTPLAELLDSSEYEDFFENSEVMTKLLRSLHELAEKGQLFCQCGNVNLDIDIYPERVELHCPDCDGSLTIYGRTQEDSRLLDSVSQIELVKETFTSMDGQRFTKHN